MPNTVTQAVVTEQSSLNRNQTVEKFALFNPDGTPAGAGSVNLVTTGSAVGTVGKSTTSAEPDSGSIVAVKFTNGNSAASPTLAFAGGTARAMKLGGTASAAAKLVVAANGIALFYFDGTDLHQVGAYT